jgi:hypothetical protein
MLITATSELRVTGHNPENADYDNPRGEILAEVFFLLAELPNGERFIGPAICEGFEEALIERAIEIAELAYSKGFEPTQEWSCYFPAYGSLAYQAMEPELVELERAQAIAA